mmetsp:Transcript_103791/g.293449  ORF Transcript_103791/g.293449 Transcript_103791/m.293449 type:complete len:207 (+) Transcript_103791:137-757(+)
MPSQVQLMTGVREVPGARNARHWRGTSTATPRRGSQSRPTRRRRSPALGAARGGWRRGMPGWTRGTTTGTTGPRTPRARRRRPCRPPPRRSGASLRWCAWRMGSGAAPPACPRRSWRPSAWRPAGSGSTTPRCWAPSPRSSGRGSRAAAPAGSAPRSWWRCSRASRSSTRTTATCSLRLPVCSAPGGLQLPSMLHSSRCSSRPSGL